MREAPLIGNIYETLLAARRYTCPETTKAPRQQTWGLPNTGARACGVLQG